MTMYIDISTVRRNEKTYKRVLLRQSYRENGKVKKRTIANLSACSDEEIEAVRFALEHKQDLADARSFADKSFSLQQGSSVGAVWLVYKLACRLGITKALGNSRQGKLALWQVIARVIGQGSRLSAVRLADNHAACGILDLDKFNEEHLYANLDWLNKNQTEIENKLFHDIYGAKKNGPFPLRCYRQLS